MQYESDSKFLYDIRSTLKQILKVLESSSTVEQRSVKPSVVGSIPTSPAIFGPLTDARNLFAGETTHRFQQRLKRDESWSIQDLDTGRMVLALFKDAVNVYMKEVEKTFLRAGYSASYASAVVAQLVREGLVKRVGRGVYRKIATRCDPTRVEGETHA